MFLGKAVTFQKHPDFFVLKQPYAVAQLDYGHTLLSAWHKLLPKCAYYLVWRGVGKGVTGHLWIILD